MGKQSLAVAAIIIVLLQQSPRLWGKTKTPFQPPTTDNPLDFAGISFGIVWFYFTQAPPAGRLCATLLKIMWFEMFINIASQSGQACEKMYPAYTVYGFTW